MSFSLLAALPGAHATATSVHHEQSTNSVPAGDTNTCSGSIPYVANLYPTPSEAYVLRCIVDHESDTDRLKVYYTTNGATPAGSFGVGEGLTSVVEGTYDCIFTFTGHTSDICRVTLPAQLAGTTVKYIIGAYSHWGGPEVFASGGFCTNSNCAQVFQYFIDTVPPVMSHPTNIVAYASDGQCARKVVFTVSATDNFDPAPVVICNPPSSSIFPVGRTTVNCTARDANGNTSTCNFVVSVYPSEGPPVAQWQQSFGGTQDDYLVTVQQTSEGGFILGGTSYSSPSGNKTSPAYGGGDFWVIRLDANGKRLWDRSFGGSGEDVLFGLQQTADGGFILAGISASSADGTKTSPNYGGFDYWAVRLDSGGNQLWDQSFGGSDDDGSSGVSLCQTSDGGFILGGDSFSGASGAKTSPNHGGSDFWVVRFDSVGNPLWDASFGGNSEDRLARLCQASDGGFLLAGSSSSSPGGTKTSAKYGSFDFWVVRLDASGNQLWDKSFGGIGSDLLYSLQVTTDGGSVLGGSSTSPPGGNKTATNYGGSDFWFIRLDASGNRIWEQDFGGSAADELRSLQQTADGGFILGGSSASNPGGNKVNANYGGKDYWLVRLDADGNKLWEEALGGSAHDNLYSLQQTSDGGYLLGGHSSSSQTGVKTSTNYGGLDFWIIKLASQVTTILCPTGILVEASSPSGAVVTFRVSATNFCQANIPVSCSPPSGATFPLGSNSVTCLAVDALGLTNQRMFSVIVRDTTPPALNCPSNVTSGVDTGECLATHVILGTAAATDLCGPVTISNNAPAQFPPGNTFVTWTATDSSGNASSCLQTVNITSAPPILTYPSNLIAVAVAGECFAPVPFTVTATDSCDPLPVIICDPPSSSSFPVGRTTVTCTARNAGGATAVGQFIVSVYPAETAPGIQWQRSFGGAGKDSLQSLQPTTDGGFILGGYSTSGPGDTKTSPNYGDNDYWVVRLDAGGNLIWDQSFGGNGYDVLSSIRQTSDGGFILGGTSSSSPGGNKTSPNYGGYDFCVVRLDANGNKLWDKSYGGADTDWLYDIQQTRDGGFVLGGWSASFPSGTKTSPNYGTADFWVVRLDANGSKLWDQSFGGSGSDSLYSLQQTDDGGFVLGGASSSASGGNKTSPNRGAADFWIVRLSANGAKIWDQSYGGDSFDVLCNLQPTTDGGFILGGYSSSGPGGTKTSPNFGDNDYWLIRLDASGNLVWERSFGGADTDGYPPNPKVQQTLDGGFILGGQSDSPPASNKTSLNYGSYDYWVVRMDAGGNKLWERSFGGSGYDALFSLQPTRDGGYVLGGVSYSGADGVKTNSSFGDADFWMIKLAGPAPAILSPTGLVVEATGPAGAAVTFAATATNICQSSVMVACTPPSGSTFPLGTNLVTCLAVDALGYSNVSTFSVVVRDTTPPALTSPPPIVTNTDPGQCYAASFSLGTPSASDLTGMVTVTNNAPVQFPKGVTLVTWVARDRGDNTSQATQSVTVLDMEPPAFSGCPLNLSVTNNPGQCGAVVNWTPPTATDNCSVTNFASNHSPGESFPVGITLVSYVATDSSANSNTCSFSVTVQDLEPPLMLTVVTNRTIPLGTNCFLRVPDLTGEVLAIDNCSGVTLVQTPPTSAKLNLGNNIVTILALDAHGNQSGCQTKVVLAADPPRAEPDTFETMANVPLILPASSLLDNDTHPDHRPIVDVAGVTPTSTNGGSIKFDGANIVYIPPTNYVGADAFTYTNADCVDLEGISQVIVSVNPLNHSFRFASINVIAASSNTVTTLQLQGLPNFTYRLQRTTKWLGLDTVWTDVAVAKSGTCDPNSGVAIFYDTNAPSPSFYRARQP